MLPDGKAMVGGVRVSPASPLFRLGLLRVARPGLFVEDQAEKGFVTWVERQVEMVVRCVALALEEAGKGPWVVRGASITTRVAVSALERAAERVNSAARAMFSDLAYPEDHYSDGLVGLEECVVGLCGALETHGVEKPLSFMPYPYPLSAEVYARLISAVFDPDDVNGELAPDHGVIEETLRVTQAALCLTDRLASLCLVQLLWSKFAGSKSPLALRALREQLAALPAAMESPANPHESEHRAAVVVPIADYCQSQLERFCTQFASDSGPKAPVASMLEMGGGGDDGRPRGDSNSLPPTLTMDSALAVIDAALFAPLLEVHVAIQAIKDRMPLPVSAAYRRGRVGDVLRKGCDHLISVLVSPFRQSGRVGVDDVAGILKRVTDEVKRGKKWFWPHLADGTEPGSLPGVAGAVDLAVQVMLAPLRDYLDHLAKSSEGAGVVPLVRALNALEAELPAESATRKRVFPRLYDGFGAAMLRWVQGHHERYHQFLLNAVKMEQWEPFDQRARQCFSHSVVDIFQMFQQAVPVIIELEVPRLAEIIEAEIHSADFVIRQYVHILAEGCLDHAALRPALPPPIADQPVWKAKINFYRLKRKAEKDKKDSSNKDQQPSAAVVVPEPSREPRASQDGPAAPSSSLARVMESTSSDDELEAPTYHDSSDEAALASSQASASAAAGSAAPGAAAAAASSPSKPSWKDRIKDKVSQARLKRAQGKEERERERALQREKERQEARERQREAREASTKAAAEDAEAGEDGGPSMAPLKTLAVRYNNLETAKSKLASLRGDLEARCRRLVDDRGVVIGSRPFAILDVTRKVMDDSAASMVRFIGLRVVYVDLVDDFEDLYVPEVSSMRIAPVLAQLDQKIGDLIAVASDGNQDDLLVSLLAACCEVLLRVLLDGGSQRTLTAQDAPLVVEDIAQLEDLFIARDERGEPQGLQPELVKRETRYLRALATEALPMPTDAIIATYPEADETSSHNPKVQNVFYRVLLHRAKLDPAAAKFIKKTAAPSQDVKRPA